MSDLDAIVGIHTAPATSPCTHQPPGCQPQPTGRPITSHSPPLDRFARLRRFGATTTDLDGTPWASWRATDGCQCHASLDHHPTATVAGWVARKEAPPEYEIAGWREVAREINRHRKGGEE